MTVTEGRKHMLQAIEIFCGQYPHATSALEAIGTLLAVMTSLGIALLAQRSNRTSLRANAAILMIVHDTIEPEQRPNITR